MVGGGRAWQQAAVWWLEQDTERSHPESRAKADREGALGMVIGFIYSKPVSSYIFPPQDHTSYVLSTAPTTGDQVF